jgi:ketosteroid isomerase-like protein
LRGLCGDAGSHQLHGTKNIEQQTELIDLFRLQDGKIIELIEFVDTAVAAK